MMSDKDRGYRDDDDMRSTQKLPTSRVHYRDERIDDGAASKRIRKDPPAAKKQSELKNPTERDKDDPKLTKKDDRSHGAGRRDHALSSSSSSNWDDKHGHYIIHLGEALGADNRYKMLDILGEGTFGKVVEVFDRDKRVRRAIKIIKAVPKYRQAAKIELRVLEKLRSSGRGRERFCVHLIGQFDFRNHICMIFEKLGLSIYDFMALEKYRPFCIEEVWHFNYQVLIALEFMHGCGLTHTDLKPENIMLDDCMCAVKGNRKYLRDTKITVIDFGSATFANEHHTKIVSTRHYRAPEVIMELGWSFQCDIWSLGCIAVELKSGEVLFQTHDNLEHLALMEKTLGRFPSEIAYWHRSAKPDSDAYRNFFNTDGELRWHDLSRQNKEYVRGIRSLDKNSKLKDMYSGSTQYGFLDFLKSMLTYDPRKRPAARKLLNSSFINMFDKNEHKNWLRNRISKILKDGSSLVEAHPKE